MTTAEILRTLEDALSPQVAENGGSIAVCEDPEDLLGILAMGANGWRLVMMANGSQAVDDNHGQVHDSELMFVLTQPRGMASSHGLSIHRDSAGRSAILTRMGVLQVWLASLKFLGANGQGHAHMAHCYPLKYKSWGWLNYEDSPNRQLQLTFSLRHVVGPADTATAVTGWRPTPETPVLVLPPGQAYYWDVIIDAADGPVVATLPAPAVHHWAATTTNHSIRVGYPEITGEGRKKDWPINLLLDRVALDPAHPFEHPRLVEFPAGSRGAVYYAAAEDHGAIAVVPGTLEEVMM